MEIVIDHSSLLPKKYPRVYRHFEVPLGLEDLLDKACTEFSKHQYIESARTFITGYQAKEAQRDNILYSLPEESLQARVKDWESTQIFHCIKDAKNLDTIGLFCLHGAALALFLEKSEDKLSLEFVKYNPFPGFGDNNMEYNKDDFPFGLTTNGPVKRGEITWNKPSNIAEILPLLDSIGRLISGERPRDSARKLAERAFIESTTVSMECGKEALQSDLLWVVAKTSEDRDISKKLMEAALQRRTEMLDVKPYPEKGEVNPVPVSDPESD